MDGSGRSPSNRTQESNAMAQQLPTDFPIDPVTTSGTALAEILNRMNEANNSNNAGATPPAATFPGMIWLDTSVSPTVVRIRNAGNTGWDSIATSNTPMMLPNGTANAPSLAFLAEPGLGLYRFGAATTGMTGSVNIIGALDVNGASLQANRIMVRNQNFGFYNGGTGGIFAFNATHYWDWSNVTGAMIWRTGGAPVTIPNMAVTTLAATGAISAAGLSSSGGISAAGDITSATRLTAGNGQIAFVAPHTYLYMGAAQGWYWVWDGNSGALTWVRPSGAAAPNTVIQSNGDFLAGGNVFAGATSALALIDAGTSRNLRFSDNNWRWSWDVASGQLGYWNATNQNLIIFGSDGNAGKAAGGTAWFVISDQRAKKDIEDWNGGLEKILSLRPRSFTLKDTGERSIGCVADEAEIGFPELIKRHRGRLGGDEIEDLAHLHIDPLYWALVNSVKTFHQRITQLENAQS
jgi:hypothetical protein